jgi:ATP-dependent helicase/nuclease subunit A
MQTNLKIENKVISASAGSGKTFQLALRYIGLIVNGAPPEKIICLTFSKKAAGEIFDKIIQRLLEWYSDKECMLKEVKIANIEPLTQDEIISIINKLLLKINKLNISTLDSFFVNILGSFPFEFGLNSNFQIIDEYEQDLIKQQILSDLLSSRSSKDEKQIIFEAFKQATFGREGKNPFNKLNEFINKYHYCFIKDPIQEHWGNKNLIWKNSTPIAKPSISDLNKNIIEFRNLLEKKNDIKEPQLEKFNEFLDEVCDYPHQYKFTDKTNRFFEANIISKLDDIKSGLATLIVNRGKLKLEPKECKPLLNIIKSIFSITFSQLLEQTKGIYKTLNLYENRYENIIRRNGRLTFNDITYLLSRDSNNNQISSYPNEDSKLYIEYRLDSSYDHWMLDEFQDTNVTQWNIISNLIDEIIMDDTFSRSFFYVGDVKQAIYAWRGGDYHLFDYVHQLYKDRFSTEELATCYRSNAQVIETVNRVFDNLSTIEKLSHKTLNLWKKGWQTHTPSPKEKKIGYSCLIKLESSKAKPDEKNQHILNILKQIEPVKRNQTVGILTYTNDTAKSISEFLQKNSIQASYEGTCALTDNPVVAVILSLIKSITHPGDLFAWEHVNMSPLYSYIKSEYHTQSLFITSELNYIYDHSYSKFIEKWVNILSNEINIKEFAVIRTSQLINAAEQFDKTGNKDALDFIDFINKYEISSSAGKTNIQLLTVYKSKGLEYDIVILPELKKKPVNKISNISGLHQKTDQNNLSEWTNYLPKRKIGEIDETINEFVDELDSEHSYESLCCLYVAMTRAKKALYMIAEQCSKTGDSLYQSDILINTLESNPLIENNQLAPVYECGNYQWFIDYAQKAKTEKIIKSDIHLTFKPIDTPKTISPSQVSDKDKSTGITELLNFSSNTLIQSGNCIHYLFEQINWLEEYNFDETQLFELLKNQYSNDIVKESIELFKNIIFDKNLSELFKKPTPQSEVWIEKEFSVIVNNKWLSGRFDRVTIIKNSSNKIEKINVLDYKLGSSNNINEYRTLYAEQLNLYEAALAKILKIPLSNIEKSLLLVKSCNIIYF